jgi:hypothetical protein
VSITGPAAYDYVRDDAQRMIRVTLRQRITAEELISVVDRQVEENAWDYGLLYDMRNIVEPIPREDAMLVSDHVATHVDVRGPRGRVALVTRNAGAIGSGQRYALDSARGGFTVQVFWDMDEAEAWLLQPR